MATRARPDGLTDPMTRPTENDDDRPDLGGFGRVVTGLIVLLLVAAIAVAVIVDPLVWVLAGVLAGTLLLWLRLVR